MFKEVAKPLSRYALDDFGCQKDAHALITEVGARRFQLGELLAHWKKHLPAEPVSKARLDY